MKKICILFIAVVLFSAVSSAQEARVFPNPVTSSGSVNVVFEQSQKIETATLTNVAGKPLGFWAVVPNNILTLPKLGRGIYFITLFLPDKKKITKKIVIH